MQTNEVDFYAAADAVILGDVEKLAALCQQDLQLTRARSPKHRATLLHYVAANGPVEDDLQRTPKNAVDVANTLFRFGAEVDAIIDGDNGSTPLVGLVTSEFPAEAGVQGALVDAFLRAGAAVNGLDDDGYPLACALCFDYPDATQALIRGGARVDNLVAIASLGSLEDVRGCFGEQGQLCATTAKYPDPFRREFDLNDVLQIAVEHAQQRQRTEVAEFLLSRVAAS